MHQINTVTGDIVGNTNKIIACLEKDAVDNVEISVFPELAISGYMCGSLWDRIDFVKDQEEKLQEIHEHFKKLKMKGIVIIGFAKFEGIKKNGNLRLKNSVAILSNDVTQTYDKMLLADSDHHEDKKYFQHGDSEQKMVFEVTIRNKKITIGVPICEDMWYTDHDRNIPMDMLTDGADLLIVPNQSYFYYGKQEKRNNLLKNLSKDLKIPIISLNSVGVGDITKNIMIFDGGSLVYNNGDLLFEFPRFVEYSYSFKISKLSPLTVLKPDNKYKEITQALIFEQKEFFRLCGIQKAQVHISGGLDSAIVAALVVKAMGKDNVIFVSNPSNLNTKSKDYVNQIEKKLGVKMWWQPIQEIVDQILAVDNHYMINDGAPKLSDTAKASIHAVLRTVLGLSDTHRFNSGIVSTGNHTEIVLGWASFHDIGSIGVHSLIGDLTKVELYELSAYINKEIYNDEVIPYDLYNDTFKPAAELPDAMEDPIDYWVQSGICASLIRDKKTKNDLISEYQKQTLNKDYFPKMDEVYKYTIGDWEKQLDFAMKAMKRSVYKAAQSAPIVVISPRSRGFSNRETLINKYNG
jgi:NAD+ synthase (glutamine-hydrolysing)